MKVDNARIDTYMDFMQEVAMLNKSHDVVVKETMLRSRSLIYRFESLRRKHKAFFLRHILLFKVADNPRG